MPRRFSLSPDEYDTPSVHALRQEWRNIPDAQAPNVIAVEAQYLAFHHYLINGLRHQAIEGSDAIPIGLSVRAGALKTATLLCASIAEAALRAHAEARNYGLTCPNARLPSSPPHCATKVPWPVQPPIEI